MENNLENYETLLNILVPLTVRNFWSVNRIKVTVNKGSCDFLLEREFIYEL